MPSQASPATDPPDRLAAYLAPQVVAEDLPALYPLLAAQPLLNAFAGLFHGGEGAVLVRLLMLRELGQRSDAPRWSRREIDAHFAYLDPTKLDTTLKRLADRARLTALSHTSLLATLRNLADALTQGGEKGEQEAYL